MIIKRGLELMASTLSSTFQKEEIGARPQVLLMKGREATIWDKIEVFGFIIS
jgi:hypothetical protein